LRHASTPTTLAAPAATNPPAKRRRVSRPIS
jgi:hypothetical protein